MIEVENFELTGDEPPVMAVAGRQIVSYGAGTNSTAILAGMYERGERPDVIVFADTGDEKPHTYEHIEVVNAWCERIGFPPITVVKGDQPQQVIDGSLSNECIRLGVLPSKAYGRGSCSLKWKVEPQRKFDREYAAKEGIELSSITRLIGFDADEPSRVDRALEYADRTPTAQRFPLVEWGWGRDECVAAIARAGLPQPGKSACFHCPSSKVAEIVELNSKYPVLMLKALEMERKALAGEGQAPAFKGRGLGRSWAWSDALKFNEAQGALFAQEADCGCYDGD